MSGEPDSIAVVLVHGMVVAGRSLVPLAAELAGRGLSCHIPDLAGFGRSTRLSRALDVDELADGVAAWAEQRGLIGVPVVGNSFGTQVAAALAQRHPELVTRLVLLSPTIDRGLRRRADWLPLRHPSRGPAQVSRRQWHAWRRRLIPTWSESPSLPSLRRLLASEYAAAGLARTLSTYRYALLDDIDARMSQLPMPVLIARAARDGAVSREWAASLAATVPDGRYVEISDADHDGQFTSPQLVAAALAPFLRGER